jgi:hypothetical protein
VKVTINPRPNGEIRGAPAIDHFTPDERAIFVRWLAQVVLDDALAEVHEGDQEHAETIDYRSTSACDPMPR